MNWYLVNVVDIEPQALPWPLPVMTIAARSVDEVRQLAELFLVGGLEIESVIELGPVSAGDEERPPGRQADATS